MFVDVARLGRDSGILGRVVVTATVRRRHQCWGLKWLLIVEKYVGDANTDLMAARTS